MHYHFLAVAVLAAAATTAQAQSFGFTGGEISAEALAYSDGGDIGSTAYSGALEFGITRNISVAVDLGFYGLQTLDLQADTATIHGIYQLSDTVSLGAFYGQDRLDGSEATVIGLEGGTEFAGVAVEGYFAQLDGAGDDATLLGVSGEYGFSDSITALGSFNIADLGDASSNRLAVGGQYTIASGPDLWAEIGTMKIDDGATVSDDMFISIGARIEFGADRGTTFGRRSLFETGTGF
jgi:hypothetical protein